MTVTKTVSIGFIGCGVMGRVYMTAAASIPFIRSAAITDLNMEAARQAAAAFGISRIHSSAEELLADPGIDAVVLALPAAVRTELALQAFRAGKHVLIEKPVAMNADEVRRMMEARGSLVAACCSARLRCQDSADAVEAIVASGRLGDIRVIRSCWQTAVKAPPEKTPPQWRLSTAVNGGGNLANLGSYALDYLLGVTGWSPRGRTRSRSPRRW
jgi:predicted dehydrogenase